MKRTRRAAFAAVLVIAVAAPQSSGTVAAQSKRNEFTAAAEMWGGTLGLAARAWPRTRLGIELGVRDPQFDLTLAPDPDQPGNPELNEHLHLALFIRFQPHEAVDVDAGVRTSTANLRDCLSERQTTWCGARYRGLYLQPMFGTRRLKVGPRGTVGLMGDGRGSSSRVLALTPITVRWTLPFQ